MTRTLCATHNGAGTTDFTQKKGNLMKKLLAAFVVISSLAGCASVPMGSPQQDSALKQFNAPAGKTGLYVYRNETFGSAITLKVKLDNAALGTTALHTYLYKEVAPGKHTLASEGDDLGLVIDAKPGKNVYVWQEIKMGFASARSKLHLMDEAAGQNGVRECKLAETK